MDNLKRLEVRDWRRKARDRREWRALWERPRFCKGLCRFIGLGKVKMHPCIGLVLYDNLNWYTFVSYLILCIFKKKIKHNWIDGWRIRCYWNVPLKLFVSLNLLHFQIMHQSQSGQIDVHHPSFLLKVVLSPGIFWKL